MRQSLSENRTTYSHPPEPATRNWPAAARAVLLAIVLSAVLVVVAIIDQTGGRSLADHVTTMYAPYGKRPDPSLLYGLVYAVAAIGALLWLLVLRVVQSRGRSAPILTVVVTTVTAALALLLFVLSEYGAQIFPPLWGILAVLPAAAGILAAVLLRRRSGRAVLRSRGSPPLSSGRPLLRMTIDRGRTHRSGLLRWSRRRRRMSRSVTISARGFGRLRGTRRGRDAGAAGAGGSVASSRRTTLPGEPRLPDLGTAEDRAPSTSELRSGHGSVVTRLACPNGKCLCDSFR